MYHYLNLIFLVTVIATLSGIVAIIIMIVQHINFILCNDDIVNTFLPKSWYVVVLLKYCCYHRDVIKFCQCKYFVLCFRICTSLISHGNL